MSESIISNERQCIVCGSTLDLHRHHIFEGFGRRQISEKHGCWCYLCSKHHNASSKYGIHFNKMLDLHVKQMCQKAWEEKHGSRDEFIRLFTRSYIED